MAKKRSVAPVLAGEKASAVAEALEPRVLFSADLAPLALFNSGLQSGATEAFHQASQTAGDLATQAMPSQLFVVDLRIADAKILLAGLMQQQLGARALGERFEILTLDAGDDGIAKIASEQFNAAGLLE